MIAATLTVDLSARTGHVRGAHRHIYQIAARVFTEQRTGASGRNAAARQTSRLGTDPALLVFNGLPKSSKPLVLPNHKARQEEA